MGHNEAQAGMSKVSETIARIAALALAFCLYRIALEHAEVVVHRHWPDARFAGFITWFVLFGAMVLCLGAAMYFVRYTFKKPPKSN